MFFNLILSTIAGPLENIQGHVAKYLSILRRIRPSSFLRTQEAAAFEKNNTNFEDNDISYSYLSYCHLYTSNQLENISEWTHENYKLLKIISLQLN